MGSNKLVDSYAAKRQDGITSESPQLSRRGFLGSLIGGVAAAAAVRTFPFRVFSFPAEIKPVLLAGNELMMITEVSLRTLTLLRAQISYQQKYNQALDEWSGYCKKDFPLGTVARVRIPQRLIIKESLPEAATRANQEHADSLSAWTNQVIGALG
jgi:hypothetical protein